jgi:hypothetical protein
MNSSATAVRFDDNSMRVELSDGRTLVVPFAWFPRLLDATKSQLEEVKIGAVRIALGGDRRGYFDRGSACGARRPDG